MIDAIVVGGGVAGLMASGIAASKGLQVLLLEKMEKPARKLRITGKGRCNITNTRPINEFLEHVHSGRNFTKYALENFDYQKVIAFFSTIGVNTITERGARVFPQSGKATEVAEAMVKWAKKEGVTIENNSPVEQILMTDNDIFSVKTATKTYTTKNCIITTGGVSYPATGSTGDGHQMAWDLGHTIIELRPALVPLEIDKHLQFKGLLLKNVTTTLVVEGQTIDSRFGEVEFTDKGLSGATVLQLSRQVVDYLIDNKQVEIQIDLKPALSKDKLKARINRELESLQSASLKILLQKLTPSALHQKISEHIAIPLHLPCTQLSDIQIVKIVDILKSLSFSILDYRPFTEAIITAGGVSLDEVDNITMASKKVKGLYFAGEVLDIDADTGGYNIQLALSTAVAAANAIIESYDTNE